MPLAFVTLAVSIGLMSVAGARTQAGGRRGGPVTAALFALTPLLWLQGQSAPASLVPLPFVAGWLLAVSRFDRDGSIWWPAIAGTCLGAGIYASYASVVMMPLFLLLTIGLAGYERALPPRPLGVMVAAFCVAAIPLAVFLILHPAVYRDTVNGFHLYDANRFNLRQGLREMASWVGLTARTEVYYDYFNPAFLFLNGRVLLFPMAVLLPVGIWQIVSNETSLLARLSLAGFLAAPFAASLTAQAPQPGRILFLTPFAALVASYGLEALLASWRVGFASRQRRP